MRAALLFLSIALAPAVRAETFWGGVTVSPASISFAATDPASPPAPVSASISWWGIGGSASRTWTVRVQASPASVTNCPNVALSAFTVTCSTLTNAASSGSCNGSFPVSGSNQTLATGPQANLLGRYVVNFTVQFSDSWRYPANAAGCALNLTYTVEAP